MNGRFRSLCAVILGLLVVFLGTASEAREDQEDEAKAESERSIVYDYKSGTFVRAQPTHPSDYRLGTSLKLDVGYDEQTYRTRDAWPDSVTRFLIKRPLDQ